MWLLLAFPFTQAFDILSLALGFPFPSAKVNGFCIVKCCIHFPLFCLLPSVCVCAYIYICLPNLYASVYTYTYIPTHALIYMYICM